MKIIKKIRQLTITFDEHYIRFLEVTMKNNQINKLHNSFAVENTVIKEGGVLDKFKWKHLLKTLLIDYKIKAKVVQVVIPSSVVIIRHQVMPDFPIKDLKQMVQYEIGNTIHFPFDFPLVDIVKIKGNERLPNEDGEATSQVAIVSVPGNLVYPMVEVLKENGLRLKAVDVPALSLYRLFNRMYPELKDKAVLLSYITEKGAELFILDSGILWCNRYIPIEIADFIKDKDQEAINDAQELLEKIQNKENYEAYLSDLGHEMERIVNFFQYTLNHRDIQLEGCFIASNLTFTEDFYNYLQQTIDLKVSPLYFQIENNTDISDKVLGYEIGIGMLFKEVN